MGSCAKPLPAEERRGPTFAQQQVAISFDLLTLREGCMVLQSV